jgi:hypothetical protein
MVVHSMLISLSDIFQALWDNKINITGAFHIGAHTCGEMNFYNRLGLSDDDILWLEANNKLVISARERGIPNVYKAVVTDQDDADIVFNISNNDQCSSVLELGTCTTEHPEVKYIETVYDKSITIDTFFKRNTIDASKYDFWNFDIQGAEFMALKGAVNSIQHAKALYLEVNEKELYKNCGLIGEIDAFLADYKFKRVLTVMTGSGWGDALYIRI